MPDGLGPNPFELKKPPEEERRAGVAVVERPPVEPELPEEMEIPDIPHTVKDPYTGKDIDLVLKQGMFLWREDKLEGFFTKKGDFITTRPEETSLWEKTEAFFSNIWRGLPINPYFWKSPQAKWGADRKDALIAWAKEADIENPEKYVEDLLTKETKELAWEAYEPEEGRLRIPELPIEPTEREKISVGERFVGEWVIPMAILSGLGLSAIKGRAALEAAKVGKPPIVRAGLEAGRVALTPVAGYEWAVGKTVQGTYNTLMSTVLRRNLHSWARSAGITIPKATEDAFVKQAVRQLSPKFMAKETIKTLFHSTKAGYIVTETGARATETAAAQAVRTSPLLLGTGKAAVSSTTLKAVVIPPITPPTVPPVKPPAVEVAKPLVEPVVAIEAEVPVIPKELPTTPPPLPPEGVALGRSENEWVGFMADLQEAQTVADVAFRNDMVRRWINLLPEIKGFFKVMNPSAVANTPAEQSIIIRAVLRDEGYQKSQGVTAFLNELGSQEKIFGGVTEKGLIKSGILKGNTVGDIAEHRLKWNAKLTDEQKVWLDRAKVIEDSIIEFLEKNGVDIKLLRLEEGGQFATRRVWARTLKDGSVIDTAYVGAGPGRPGGRLPTERHRIFKTELEAIEAGYRYLPYEEALYLKVSGAYNRVADKQMADWLLTKVPWRTTGAPEELKLAAETAVLKKRHSQQLLAALNRAVRGERVPDVTIRAIATSYPDQAQRLKDLIPRIQAGEPTAKEVQDLTRVAKGLIDTNKGEAQRAINARARARERALLPRYEEAIIPAPAFAGKILTGPEAKETARALRKAFDPSFNRALAQVNKANAVARYFMLAGDYSPFVIQLIFLIGENPKIYGKAFGGAVRAMLDPKFHSKFLLKHKATIDKHPNLLITKAGATEFTEAMARGGWLSGKTALIPMAESYWKTLSLFLPRAVGKVGGTVLTPFQRVFEYSLDSAGIYMAEAYDYMCTTPARTADVDQFINEFRGLTSSARIGVDVLQRQIETGSILAPRYNRAIAGLLYDVGTGGIRGSLARKSLAKGIAAICAIAAVISIARGESQEEILDHYNPNSPNFFTWDIYGQKVGPGSKVRSVMKLFAQSVDNPDSLFQLSNPMDSPAFRFLRGNLSPAVASGYDLITGRSYIGDPTRDGMLSFSKEIIGGNLLPIWVQTVLMEGGDVKGRTVRGIAEFFGGRSYPEPVWSEVAKLRDKYAKQDFNVKYEDLNRAQIDRLGLNHPDLKDLEEKARLEGAERGTEFEKWVYETREQIVAERNEALERAAVTLLSGLMSKRDYDSERGYARPYYSGGMSVLWLARESLDAYSIKQIEKWIGENQKPEDKAVDAYQEYRANLIQKADLPKDWDKIEAQCEAYLSRFSKSIRDYVRAMVNRWINDLPPNARNVELMRLQGIEDETWWDDYRGPSLPRARRIPTPTPPGQEGLGPNPFK